MNNTDILLLDLEAAEQEARDILTKEGIDPDKIERHFFSGWPETKIYYADIGYLNPKLSKFSETAHYAYRMIGACMLIREVLKERKDDDEIKRMTYMLNLGTFREISAVGLNVPRARKFYRIEHNKRNSTKKKGSEGDLRKTIRMIGEKQEHPSFNSIIEAMKEIIESSEPNELGTPLTVQKINWDYEVVHFSDHKKHFKETTFKTIRNHITKLFPSK